MLNKTDLLPTGRRAELRNTADEMYVSARSGEGLGALVARLDAMVQVDPVKRARLRVPQANGKALAILEAHARILTREYDEGCVVLEVDAPESVLRELAGHNNGPTIKEAVIFL